MGEFTVAPELKKWASKTQAEYIDAINEHGSIRAAARALGKAKSTLDGCLAAVRKNAALKGYAPSYDMVREVPDPFVVRGVSTYYGKSGEVEGQWVKSQLDGRRLAEMMRAAADAMAEELPRTAPVAAPARVSDDLLVMFPFTDCHVNMLAWHREGGADWDLRIAERTLTGCFLEMISAAPRAKKCVIAEMGDLLHFDSMQAVTPTHGFVLDGDGRYSKGVAVVIRILRRMIAAALEHFEEVELLFADANHDPVAQIWLRHMFAALFEREPRIKVHDSELPYYAIQFGKVFLGYHHGHLVKTPSLPLLFAAQFPKMWGDTTKRYINTGHLHCKLEKEYPGVLLIQHPTLAAKDAYAARNGYLSERDATAMTFHKEYGLVARNTVMPEMLDGYDDANSNVIALREAA